MLYRYLLIIITSLLLGIPAITIAASVSVNVIDDKGTPLPDVVVYITNGQPVADKTGEKTIYIEQKNKAFSPFVTVTAVGTKAYFPNRDNIGHHVYSFSSTKVFELPLSEEETTDSVIFDKPGIVTVGCNIHDWMVAYINVVPTLYFAKTGNDGNASIKGLPDGDLQIHIWHPGMKGNKEIIRTIGIGPEGSLAFEFSLSLKPVYFWHPEPLDEDGEEY